MKVKFDKVLGKAREADSSDPIVSKTYAELAAMVAASSLVPGQKYLITDFRTRYLMPNTFEYAGNAYYYEAAVESICVTAISNNTLHHEVTSDLYPQDIIWYELTDTSQQGGGDRGRIVYRKDTVKNIELYEDWRHTMYRRWETAPGSGAFEALMDNGGSYQDFPIFQPLISTFKDVSISGCPEGYSNNVFTTTGEVNAVKAGVRFTGNTFFGDTRKSSWGNYCNGGIYRGWYSESRAGDEFSYNDVADSCDRLVADNGCGGNVWSGPQDGVVLGKGCQNNHFNPNAVGVTLENYVQLCTFGQNTTNINVTAGTYGQTFPDNLSNAYGIGNGIAYKSGSVAIGANVFGYNSIGILSTIIGNSSIGFGPITLVDENRFGVGKVNCGLRSNVFLQGFAPDGSKTALVWSEVDFNTAFAGQTTITLTSPDSYGITPAPNAARIGDRLSIWNQTIGGYEDDFYVVAATPTTITLDRAVSSVGGGYEYTWKNRMVPLGVFDDEASHQDISVRFSRWIDPVTFKWNDEAVGGGAALAAGTTTTITDARVKATSYIMITPTSAAYQPLNPYVSAKANGSFTLIHAAAAGTETFDYAIIN